MYAPSPHLQAFRQIDGKGNGIISKRELRDLLYRFIMPMTDVEFKKLWARYEPYLFFLIQTFSMLLLFFSFLRSADVFSVFSQFIQSYLRKHSVFIWISSLFPITSVQKYMFFFVCALQHVFPDCLLLVDQVTQAKSLGVWLVAITTFSPISSISSNVTHRHKTE